MTGVRFVLVRPRNPENIAAAARALANFGFSDLRVVGVHPPVWEKTKAAMVGGRVLAAARAHASIAEAVADCAEVWGTDSTARRALDAPVRSVAGVRPAALPAAVLFGSEKTGLTNDELAHCRGVLTVPNAAGAESMNLGQAVAVVAWELSGRGAGWSAPEPAAARPAEAAVLDRLVESTLAMLGRIDYLGWIPEDRMRVRLRETFGRWDLKRRDVTTLLQVVRRIARRAAATPPRGS